MNRKDPSEPAATDDRQLKRESALKPVNAAALATTLSAELSARAAGIHPVRTVVFERKREPVRHRARRLHRLTKATAVALTFAVVATAFDTSSSAETKTAAGSDPVTLQVYVPINTPTLSSQQNQVFAAANKIIKSKIHVTVDWHPLIATDYDTKMPTLLASHESIDLLQMADWMFGYNTYADQGSLYPMNRLLKKYGKGLEASMPKFMLDAGAINGKIYGIGALQQNTLDPEWTVSEGVLKASGAKGIDADGNVFLSKKSGGYNYRENLVAPLLKAAASNKTYMAANPKGYEGLLGYMAEAPGGAFDPMAYGYWPLDPSIHTGDPLYVKMGTTKVTTALPALKSYFKMMRSFYLDGYLEKNVGSPPATLPTVTENYYGATAGWSGGGYLGSAGTYSGATPKTPMERRAAELMLPLSPRPFFMGYNGGWSIPATSAHPQDAMKLLNLLFTDAKLVDLLAYGFPKSDYTVVNGTITQPANDKYLSGTSCWAWGNCWITPTWPYAANTLAAGPKFWSEVKKWNDKAIPAPLESFSLNTQPISSQWSALSSAIATYDVPLYTGSQPLKTEVPKWLHAMDSAGLQSVVREAQKQLNAFLAKNPAAKKALLSDTYSKLMSMSPTSLLAGPAPVESLAQALKTVPVG